jgi:hypothetical protein
MRLASAHPVETIETFSVTNYTGYIIASDASNAGAGYHRDAIRTSAQIRYETTSNTTATVSYRIVFRLLDSGGNAVPIYDENGETNTTYTVSDSVALPFTIFNITIKTWTENYGAPLVPVNRLDPHEQYRPEVHLYQQSLFGLYLSTGDVATDFAQTYVHFTNTSSPDSAVNVVPVVNGANFNQLYAIDTDPDKESFGINANLTLHRYDNYLSAVGSANVQLAADIELRDAATDALIPLETNRVTFTRSMFSYLAGSPNSPRTLVVNETLRFRPAPGVQLDPVNKLYRAQLTFSHVETLGYVTDRTITSSPVRLLHFNGTLHFGDIETQFTSVANNPFLGSLVAGSHVNTQLAVDGNSGFVAGMPSHTYGDGTALSVRLKANGDAELSAGSVVLTGPAGDLDAAGNVRFLRGPVTLDTTGAHGDLSVALPTGFGYRANMNSRILSAVIFYPNVKYDQTLKPAEDLVNTVPIFVAEETKPVWMEVSRTVWKVAEGEFVMDATSGAHYVRAKEFAELEAAPVIDPAMRMKRSNEQYFRSITKVSSALIVVKADNNGNARMTVDYEFGPGDFRTHFPYDSRVAWVDGGAMKVEEDLVQPSDSALKGITSVAMRYDRECPDGDCPGGIVAAVMGFKPEDGTLTFTEDGGLTRPGLLSTAEPLQWGWIDAYSRFAHETEEWTEANLHVPGLFLRGDRTTKSFAHKPAVVLYTGVLPATPAVTERPGTTGYQNGFGDYAGLNFRVGADGALEGESTLASKATGKYPLTGRSKYYTRPAGVSGIHEAVFGSFPSSATLYGYQIQFSNFGLAFLDSNNTDSRTEGSIHVPSPSGFDQNFEKLLFTCLGALDKAEVPSDEAGVVKILQYWQAEFTTLAIDFMSDAACDPGVGYLTLGVGAWASHVDSQLYGKLGFRSNGNLITQDDGLVAGVTSRLKMPNAFKLKGPNSQKYHFTPVGEAYYNNHEHAAGESVGWINIAGKMDVPFFEDLKVHMHTSAQQSNTTAIIHLMGGWPSQGFEIAGQNYFTVSLFDGDNRGFPSGGSVTAYRNGNDSGLYHVRAQRNWLEVVDFDYPLAWSSSLRSFKSLKPEINELLVLEVEHQVKYLDAENAELTFGIEYEGMPKVNIANLAFNAIDEATGVAQAFTEAGLGAVRGAVDEGLKQMNKMLADQMHAFFDSSFDALLKPQIEAMYDELKAGFDPGSHSWTINPNQKIEHWITGGGPIAETFAKRLKNITGTINDAAGVVKELDSGLEDFEAAIGGIEQILAETGGNRTIATQLIKKLVGQLAAEFAGAFIDSKLNEFLAEADPTLDQIHSVLTQLKGIVSTIRSQLGVGSQFAEELTAKVNSLAAEIDTVAVKVRTDVQQYFNGMNIAIDSPFDHYSKEEVVEFIRLKLEDRFFASTVPTAVQVIIKERVYDLDAAVREGIDSAFQQVNNVIKEVISETLAELDNSINGMLGQVNDVLGAGKINGYAHINNDALKLLRLDIYAQLKVPSEMELNAFIQIKELDSDGYPTECLPAGGKATEVTVGATDVKVGWISPDLVASIAFKATFDPGTTPPMLMGIGGSLELDGEISFEAFKVKYLAASIAFGLEENYLSCAARVAVNKYEGFGGIYFGRTCTLDPIALWDPDVAGALGTPPFTGAYVYCEVWIPISEALLGIPASCLFNITAGVGAGAFYFVEGPTYGGKMMLGVHGELLCIVSVGGTVKLVGVKNPDGLTLKGTGEVHGEIGPCPFCISFSKSIGMQYKNGSWDVDF